jgi:hypothetical protein
LSDHPGRGMNPGGVGLWGGKFSRRGCSSHPATEVSILVRWLSSKLIAHLYQDRCQRKPDGR